MKNFSFRSYLPITLLFLVIHSSLAEFKTCKPNGAVKGQKAPPGACNEVDCCIEGKSYPTYKCSPPVSSQNTRAILTLNSFESNVGASKSTTSYGSGCDGKYYTDEMLIVALSTGWYNRGQRCLNNITISAPSGRSVHAIVVDECDSTRGCDMDNDYLPPCASNIDDASKGVWKALGVPQEQWGKLSITWV